MIFRTMLLVVCAAAGLHAQAQFVFNDQFNLAAAAGVWTIQQPTTGGVRVNFKYLTISSSAAMRITFERQCATPASSTSATILRKNPEFTSVTPKATAWKSSNAASCTVMYGPIDVPAGGPITVSFDGEYLNGSGTDKGLTIRSNSVTATGSFNLHFEEIR